MNGFQNTMRPQERLEVDARRVLVAEGIRAGKTYRALAAEFGVSYGSISQDIKAVRKEWAKEKFISYEEAIAEKRQMLLAIAHANSASAMRGDVSAGTLVVRTIDLLARLEGLTEWAAETARIRARELLGRSDDAHGPIGLQIEIIQAGNRAGMVEMEDEDDE